MEVFFDNEFFMCTFAINSNEVYRSCNTGSAYFIN